MLAIRIHQQTVESRHPHPCTHLRQPGGVNRVRNQRNFLWSTKLRNRYFRDIHNRGISFLLLFNRNEGESVRLRLGRRPDLGIGFQRLLTQFFRRRRSRKGGGGIFN